MSRRVWNCSVTTTGAILRVSDLPVYVVVVSHLTDADLAPDQQWHDCSVLTAALQQVQSTLTELDLSANIYSEAGLHVEFLNELQPVSGQLALREFPRLRKLKAPIATLLGWSPDDPRPLAEVVPAGLTHLCLTEDLALLCSYKWVEKLVLKELAAFLAVWRSATPDLQAVEFWLNGSWTRWHEDVEQLRTMCEEAGVRYAVRWLWGSSWSGRSSMTYPWLRQNWQDKSDIR